MRWRRKPAPQPPPDTEDGLEEARKAREESEKALKEVCERWPEVEEVASSLRRHRERNGFRELFERALRGGHGSSAG